jgi:uncharacterized protein YprB with RNaseH-like and TPR domain
MLNQSFCHLPGIGRVKETRLWQRGILSWEDARTRLDPDGKGNRALLKGVEESRDRLAKKDSRYFGRLLPSDQQFRLFDAFRHTVVYLDIETTGLSPWDEVTTIATWDGNRIQTYVQGQNLEDFSSDIKTYGLIVTFNGKTFDLPFLRNRLGCPLDQAHIDLRYVLASLGYKGGLKKCEKALGLDRGDLKGVDGSLAVLLWNEYGQTGNPRALETLLAYNIEDVVNLETLMVLAYNMKLSELGCNGQVSEPRRPDIPYAPDPSLVRRLSAQFFSPWD